MSLLTNPCACVCDIIRHTRLCESVPGIDTTNCRHPVNQPVRVRFYFSHRKVHNGTVYSFLFVIYMSGQGS